MDLEVYKPSNKLEWVSDKEMNCIIDNKFITIININDVNNNSLDKIFYHVDKYYENNLNGTFNLYGWNIILIEIN